MSATVSNAASGRLTTARLTEEELAVLQTHLQDFKRTVRPNRKVLLKAIYKEVKVLTNNRSLLPEEWRRKTQVSAVFQPVQSARFKKNKTKVYQILVL
jgi:hypothetical protein